MPWVPAAGTVGWIAGSLGLVGLVVVVFGARGRSPVRLALLVVFSVMAVGGALLLRPGDVTQPWGLRLALLAAAGGCVIAALMARRDTQLARDTENARAAATANKRELDALEAVKKSLEDQLVSTRKRINQLLEKTPDAPEPDPERIERLKERVRLLQAREEKLRQIVDHARDGVVMLENETLRLARITPSVARLTGHAPDALVEKTLLDLIEKGPAEPGRADLQRVAHERRPLAAKLVRADGTRLPVEISVHPVGDGDDVQLMALLRDDSVPARLRRQLDELREELAERERSLTRIEAERAADAGRVMELERELGLLRDAKDQAVEAVAHDLRVPLTSVRSFSEILLRHADAEPQVQREFLDIIRKESERLTRMIDELLDVRRIRRGEEPLHPDDLDLRDVLRASLDGLSGLATERGVRFEGVWDREERLVRGERDRLQRMLVNLLSNAVEFSASGSSVEILLREGKRPGTTLLGIRDHGVRVTAIAGDEDEPHDDDIVFERFHAASGGPDQVPGSGVGMSICREIAAAHGARMWPESRGAAGTTLWVEFPPPGELVAQAAAPALDAASSA